MTEYNDKLLTRYKAYTKIMLEAEINGDEEFVDILQDLMDNIWMQLTDSEHEELNIMLLSDYK